MVVQLVNDSWRRPGCGPDCREAWVMPIGLKGRERVEIHDPQAHEDYAAGIGSSGVVETGPLAINLHTQMVSLDGRELHVSPMEWRLLSLLAGRLGALVAYDDCREHLHGEGWQYVCKNGLRALMGRLKHRLGRAHVLAQTIPYRGYRLMMLPPGPEIPPELERPPLPWAIHYDACQDCGRTDVHHFAGGLCQACTHRKRRRP